MIGNKEIFIALAILSLASCARTIELCDCPSPINYSKEFQDNLVRDLESINSYYINQIVIDMFNLNRELKEINNN